MAFSNNPAQDTYSTQRVQLTREINTRVGEFGAKDEDFLNCYIDQVKDRVAEDKRIFITKRAGSATFLASVASSTVRGMFYWADQNKLFYAVDNDIYSYNLATDVNTTISNPFGTTTGEVGFCEYLYDTNASVVIATDGTTLITIDTSNTVTTCVDADLPAPHIPSPVFLDGYLFLAKKDTGDIYNSDLNDPLAWTAGNFISAEIEGDFVQKLAKMNNYLIALGKKTIEYFWDAAVETGSPMQRNDSVVKHVGFLGGFAKQANRIFFVGTDSDGQLDVFVLEDLKITQVGSPVVSRYLNQEAVNHSTIKGNIISISGRTFYIIYDGTYTYVLDTETRVWARWAFQDTDHFPITYSANVKTSLTYKPIFALGLASSTLYYFSDTVYEDNSEPFSVEIVTEPADFNTMNRKNMHRLILIADRPPSASNVLIQWSDDDYQNWNAGVNINLDQDLPSTTRLGNFRQRSFKLTYTDNYPFRIQRLEVNINKGTR